MQYNIFIVEDELLIAEMLKDFLLALGYSVSGVVSDVDSAEKYLSTHPKPDLIMLDINLESHKSGFDLASVLYHDYKIPFVFLTSYADTRTITDAIALKPEAYLLKPFKSTDLFTTIEIIRSRQNWKPDKNDIVIVKDGNQIIRLDLNDILWMKSDNVYVEVQLLEKKILLRKSLEGLIAELNCDSIVRTHRSYAVNLLHLKAISGSNLQLGDEIIPLSRMHKDDLVRKFRDLNQ